MVGSCNVDLIARVPRMPQPGETLTGSHFQIGFGGKGANQAVMSAKLGAHVSVVGRVGNDVFGTNTFHLGTSPDRAAAGERLIVTFRFRLALGAGSYAVSVAAHTGDVHSADNFDWWDRALVFEVVPGIYQIRGLDLSNMTLIEGKKGVIVIDPLVTAETARAGLELYRQHRGPRPVAPRARGTAPARPRAQAARPAAWRRPFGAPRPRPAWISTF